MTTAVARRYARKAWAVAFAQLSRRPMPRRRWRSTISGWPVSPPSTPATTTLSVDLADARSHRAAIEAGEFPRAARVGVLARDGVLRRGEMAPAGGWLARATRPARRARPRHGRARLPGRPRRHPPGRGATRRPRSRSSSSVGDRRAVRRRRPRGHVAPRPGPVAHRAGRGRARRGVPRRRHGRGDVR